ncbi:MAG: ABC transporter permease [Planctomycetales bacterium]
MIARYRREISVTVANALLLGILAVAAPGFFKPQQLQAFIVTTAPVLVVAVGMTLVMLTRQIDISVGSQFSLLGIIAGLLSAAGCPMPVVIILTIVCGMGFGAINGTLVAIWGLPPIVVTLAMMVILRESLGWWREGEFVRNLPDGFQWFGAGQDAGQWIVVAAAVLILLLFSWALRYLPLGRAVYATGSAPEAARLMGIRPRAVVFSVFTVMGGLVGLASLLNDVRFASVDPKSGQGLELQAIAAVVVGGTAVSGGRGTLLGTLIGVLLLGSIGPALVHLHAPPQWEKAIQGAIILLAVASDAFRKEHN